MPAPLKIINGWPGWPRFFAASRTPDVVKKIQRGRMTVAVSPTAVLSSLAEMRYLPSAEKAQGVYDSRMTGELGLYFPRCRIEE